MGSSLLWNGWVEVPYASGPRGQTNVDPAAVAGTAGCNLAVLATGLDRAVWWNWFDGQNWSGWKSMGGQTDFGPCVIPSTNDFPYRRTGMMAYATGTNPPGHIFSNLMENNPQEGWGGWAEIDEAGVAIAAPSAHLDVLFPGTDQRVYIKSANLPITELAPGGLLTTQGLCTVPHLIEGEGPLQYYAVAFAVSTDQKIYQNIYFTRGISLPTGQWTEVPGGGVTNVAVAATNLPGTNATCLFAVGTDNKIYVNELSPTAFGDISGSWNGWGKLDDVGTTDVAVAAVTFDPLVYLFRKGLGDDKGIYFRVGEYPPR